MQSFIVKSIFLFIIFSNNTFAKDFDNLFIITTEIEAENLDKYIDQSFNNLIFRLLGYKDFEKAKTIKGKYNSKDFQIDNGFNKPFKMESIPYETKFESSIQKIFQDISEKRGIFFEFPQNTINIDKKNYFFENENDNEYKKYKFDYFDSIIISRSGINNWSINFKNQILFFENTDEIIKKIKNLFENLATDYLSDFILDSSQRIMMMKVTKVSSADKLDNLLAILDKMISIKEYSITSFKQNEITFSLKIFGTEDQFIQTVKTHKDFLLEEYSTELIHASLSTI